MMGFLDETEEEILQTIHFALKSRLVIASFFILTPFRILKFITKQ